MTFGLCNVPVTYICLQNDVSCPFIHSFSIFCSDNILILSSTWEKHISYLTQVLETLKKHELLANIKKCEFAKQSLRSWTSNWWRSAENWSNEDWIHQQVPTPTSVAEVRSFMGATQYLRKFIASFLVIAAPLHIVIMSGISMGGKLAGVFWRDVEEDQWSIGVVNA